MNASGMVPGLLYLAKRRVRLGVAVDQRLERTAVRAALAHVDFVVAQEDLRVDHPAAGRADAAGQL